MFSYPVQPVQLFNIQQHIQLISFAMSINHQCSSLAVADDGYPTLWEWDYRICLPILLNWDQDGMPVFLGLPVQTEMLKETLSGPQRRRRSSWIVDMKYLTLTSVIPLHSCSTWRVAHHALFSTCLHHNMSTHKAGHSKVPSSTHSCVCVCVSEWERAYVVSRHSGQWP